MVFQLHQEQSKVVLGFPVLILGVPSFYQLVYVHIFHIYPAEKAYGVYKSTMWKLIRFILTGQMSIEQTLEQGQEIIDSKLELLH